MNDSRLDAGLRPGISTFPMKHQILTIRLSLQSVFRFCRQIYTPPPPPPLPEHQPEHAQYDHQRVQHAPPPLPEPDQSILRGQDGCRRPAGPQSIPTLRREPAQMTTQGGRQLMAAQCRKPCHRLLKVHHPTAGQSRATQGGRLHVLDSEIHHVGTRDHLTKRRLP